MASDRGGRLRHGHVGWVGWVGCVLWLWLRRAYYSYVQGLIADFFYERARTN